MTFLEQGFMNKIFEKKKEIILEAAKFVQEKQTILRNHFERNFLSELEKSKNKQLKKFLQLLYNKGLFDSFGKKDQIFQSFLTFTDECSSEKYGTEIKTSDGVYYVSGLDNSTKEDILKCLKEDDNTEVVDLKWKKIDQFRAQFHTFRLNE